MSDEKINQPEKEITLSEKRSGDYDTIVLSGGSIHGIIVLGCIQYMIDNNILNKINIYIGTSIGSIIAYLLAIGCTPIDIIVYICTKQVTDKLKHFDIVAMMRKEGASSFNHIQEHLEKITIEKIGRLVTLKELYTLFGKTLICNSYNKTLEKEEILSHESFPDMPCLIALRLSSNLPFVFDEFKYLGSKYIDGGISNNFLINIGDKVGTKIIGIWLYNDVDNSKNDSDSILSDIYQMLYVPINQVVKNNIDNSSDKCTIISLTYEKRLFFNFNIDNRSKLEMFSSGYIQSKQFFINKL